MKRYVVRMTLKVINIFLQECTDHLLDNLDHQLKVVEDENKEYRYKCWEPSKTNTAWPL